MSVASYYSQGSARRSTSRPAQGYEPDHHHRHHHSRRRRDDHNGRDVAPDDYSVSSADQPHSSQLDNESNINGSSRRRRRQARRAAADQAVVLYGTPKASRSRSRSRSRRRRGDYEVARRGPYQDYDEPPPPYDAPESYYGDGNDSDGAKTRRSGRSVRDRELRGRQDDLGLLALAALMLAALFCVRRMR